MLKNGLALYWLDSLKAFMESVLMKARSFPMMALIKINDLENIKTNDFV